MEFKSAGEQKANSDWPLGQVRITSDASLPMKAAPGISVMIQDEPRDLSATANADISALSSDDRIPRIWLDQFPYQAFRW